MSRQVPWLRALIEGVVIVGSILLAFGIDAWWEGRRERGEEQELLADLISEFTENRAALERVTEQHRARDTLYATVIREAGPDRMGVGSDSLRALAESLFLTPLVSVETGVLARAQSGNGLALLSDRELRAEVAGFWDRYEYYFVDQMIVLDRLVTPESLFGTGSLVYVSIPEWESMGPSEMWSDPLTPEEVNAVKFFAYWRGMGQLLVTQGEPIIAAIDALIADLERARSD